MILTTRYDCLQNDIDWERLKRIILKGRRGFRAREWDDAINVLNREPAKRPAA